MDEVLGNTQYTCLGSIKEQTKLNYERPYEFVCIRWYLVSSAKWTLIKSLSRLEYVEGPRKACYKSVHFLYPWYVLLSESLPTS